MKKAISLLLSLALLCTVSLPAAAAESADARLAAVTVKVKQTLQIPDTFDTFSGALSEGESTPVWQLRWQSDDASIAVTADEHGKIYRYDLREASAERPRDDMTLPAPDNAPARAAADAFLSAVLDPALERAQYDDADHSRRSSDSYYFSGTLLLHGLPSPYDFSLTVRAEDAVVTRFDRRDLYLQLLGGVPGATPATGVAPAATLLKDTLKLRPVYVRDADETQAVLRYLPESGDAYYVDAQSGHCVNLTERMRELQRSGDRVENAAADAGMGTGAAKPEAGLSEVEQAGVAQLEGVLSATALDTALRAVPALGLKPYTLSRTSYTVDEESGDVSAALLYARRSGEETYQRNVNVDAKTGAILSVHSYTPYWAKNVDGAKTPPSNISAETAQKNAAAFLNAQQPAFFARAKLYTEDMAHVENPALFCAFAQQENGYFFPENAAQIAIDPADGSIAAYDWQYDPNITFDDVTGVIPPAAALDAYFSTFSVPLGYLAVPQKLDLSVPGARPLLALGQSYYNALTLTYTLAQDSDVIGIDAKTGKPVAPRPAATAEQIAYSDLDGVWGAAEIRALAQYGIGWQGGTFQPKKALTQADLLALLAAAQHYSFDISDQDGLDELYRWAYAQQLLQKDARQEGKELTRMETVRFILNAGGYGDVAALPGIFKCDYTDAAKLAPSDLGYAALAQAMGVVKGDTQGQFAPARIATRQEGALMLYGFLRR